MGPLWERKMKTETELLKSGAVWHEAMGSIDPRCKRGWYLPSGGAGIPMRQEDLDRMGRSPWGIFLGARDKAALTKLKEL